MPPEVGTSDKGAAATGSSSASTGASSSGNVTSGTASAAMIAAATAASSAEGSPAAPAAGTASPSAGAADSGQPTTGATGQPTGDAAAAAAATGEAPESRIQKAVKNAREAAIAEFAWAKGLDPTAVKQALSLLQGIQANPRAFWEEMGKRINVQEDKPETLPDADLISEDGKLRTYSDATFKKALEIHEKNILRRLQGQLQPYMDYVDGERTTRTAEEQASARRAHGAQVLSHARENFPHFKENESAIKEKLNSEPFQQLRKQFGAIAALNMAYAAVLKEKVFPGIETASDARIREEFKKKAVAGSGSAHPADQSGDGKKPELRNVDELARHMERMATTAIA